MTQLATTSVLEDTANAAFLDLLEADNAELIGEICVDSGQIELGDCGQVQLSTSTRFGDGFYSVWKGRKYLVIEIDAVNMTSMEEALES